MPSSLIGAYGMEYTCMFMEYMYMYMYMQYWHDTCIIHVCTHCTQVGDTLHNMLKITQQNVIETTPLVATTLFC